MRVSYVYSCIPDVIVSMHVLSNLLLLDDAFLANVKEFESLVAREQRQKIFGKFTFRF